MQAEDKAKQQLTEATAAVRKEAADRIAELEKQIHEKDVSTISAQSNSCVGSMHEGMSTSELNSIYVLHNVSYDCHSYLQPNAMEKMLGRAVLNVPKLSGMSLRLPWQRWKA